MNTLIRDIKGIVTNSVLDGRVKLEPRSKNSK